MTKTRWPFIVKTSSFCVFLLLVAFVSASLLPDDPRLVNDSSYEPITFDDTQLDEADMQRLLHWAIEHSDPSKLESMAANEDEWRAHLHDADWLRQRRAELQETMQYLAQSRPSEGDLMREAIGILVDAESPYALKLAALEQLAALVEPIDNANDFPKFEHALDAVLSVLGVEEWEEGGGDGEQGTTPEGGGESIPSLASLQCAAANVIRTAASNNPIFTFALMSARPDVIPLLTSLVSNTSSSSLSALGASSPDACFLPVRALGALSNILRTDATARSIFFEMGGLDVLERLVSEAGSEERERTLRVRIRALDLLTDLAIMLPAPEFETVLAHALVQRPKHEASRSSSSSSSSLSAAAVLERIGLTLLDVTNAAAKATHVTFAALETTTRHADLLERASLALAAMLEHNHLPCSSRTSSSPFASSSSPDLVSHLDRILSECDKVQDEIYVEDLREAVIALRSSMRCDDGRKGPRGVRVETSGEGVSHVGGEANQEQEIKALL